MSTVDENAKVISNFGLTFNQAKVYLAIVQEGLVSAGKIAKISKIRREEVYRIFPSLEKLGLIIRIPGVPLKFRAVPIDDVLSILIKREKESAEKKIKDLSTEKDNFLKKLELNSGKEVYEKEKDQFALLMSKEAINSRIALVFSKAKRNIDIVDSSLNVILYPNESIKTILPADFKIRVITEPSNKNEQTLKLLNQSAWRNTFDLRYLKNIPCELILANGSEAILCMNMKRDLPEKLALWTSNKELLDLLQKRFEILFHASNK